MRFQTFGFVLAVVVGMAQPGLGQHSHSDVEISYHGNKIDVHFGSEGRVFEGELPTAGTDLQFTGEPGFASEVSEGMGVGANDEIIYNVLDDLLYWDGTSISTSGSGTQIRIGNRPPTVPDTVVSGTSGLQRGSFSPAANRVGAADGAGDFHSDLDWFLESSPGNPSTGAYAVKLSLSTNAAGIADSDEFFIVYNFGLTPVAFEEGVEAFAALVPEPTSLMLIVIGLTVFWRTPRRW